MDEAEAIRLAEAAASIYVTTMGALIKNGKSEADAATIASATANAATEAYQTEMDTSGDAVLANRAASWTAYTMAFEMAYDEEEVKRLENEMVSGQISYDQLLQVIESFATCAFEASEGAYKSAMTAYNGKELSEQEMVSARAYSSTLDMMSMLSSCIPSSARPTPDYCVSIAQEAEDAAQTAYNHAIANAEDPGYAAGSAVYFLTQAESNGLLQSGPYPDPDLSVLHFGDVALSECVPDSPAYRTAWSVGSRVSAENFLIQFAFANAVRQYVAGL
jgi:hypothetical protein